MKKILLSLLVLDVLQYSERLRSFWNVYDRLVYRLLHGIDCDVSTCPLVVFIRRWCRFTERGY